MKRLDKCNFYRRCVYHT